MSRINLISIYVKNRLQCDPHTWNSKLFTWALNNENDGGKGTLSGNISGP